MINDCQQRKTATQGLSYIAVLICRFAEIEKLYLRDKRCTDTTALASETINLYRSILEFQIRVICQLDRNTAHQYARNVINADGWEKQIDQIMLFEAACEKCRVLLDTKERQQGMERLECRLRELGCEVHTILSELKSLRSDQECRNMSPLESDCLSTLRTLDYESDKSRIANRVANTCEWFLSHDKYKIWLDETRSRLLWVTADPGCGKSVLSKFLIDRYIRNATSGTTSVCYFFFRDGSEKNQDGTNALCALLHQLFQQKRTLLRHALLDFEHNKTKLSGLFETLWSIFYKAVTDSEAGSIICVLDALDECGERTRKQLLRHIGRFFSDPPASASVKFIVTSRPYAMIVDSLWETYPNVPSVRLMGESECEMSTIQKEISWVIDERVEKFREKRQRYGIHDDTHHAISEQLAQIENRTYLWVSLIFQELDKNVRSGQSNLLRVIKELPSTVQEAYEKILNDSTDTTKARKLLHIVLAAQRPFTLQEMNTALAITEDCASADDLELEPEATFQETVRELCGLFISVSESKIYLIHQTAREFLLAPNSKTKPAPNVKDIWMYSMDLNQSHFELTKICLLYLHLSGLDLDPVIDGCGRMIEHRDFAIYSRSIQALQKQAFQVYSAAWWIYHLLRTKSEAVSSLMNSVLSITTPSSQAFLNWSQSCEQIKGMDQLTIAASSGLSLVVRSLLERGQQSTIERSAIDQAAVYAINYCSDTFHLFLQRGLDLKAQVHHRILHEAVDWGSIESVRLLIEAGAAVDREDKDLREPLYYAVRRGSREILSLLVEKGAHINHRDRDGQTVLHVAIVQRSPDMLTYLLDHGAEVESTDNSGRTSLFSISSLSVTEILIKHGVKINSVDNTGRTPLSYVASTQRGDIMSLLIKHGAQADSKDQYGRTPLSYAAAYCPKNDGVMVRLLIQQDAQIDTRCCELRTPLSYAAKSWSMSNLGCLIENGAAVNTSDWKGNTPLMYAAQIKGDIHRRTTLLQIRDAITKLLDKGANADIVNADGDSPLSIFEQWPSDWPSYPEYHSERVKEEKLKEEIKSLLRRHGAQEKKSPTSADVLSQVVAQLIMNSIKIGTSALSIESTEHQIAMGSSVQLFRGLHLYPTVSSIQLQDNMTVEQKIAEFMQAQVGKHVQGTAHSESSLKEHLGTVPEQSEILQPNGHDSSNFHELEVPKMGATEENNKYGGLMSLQASKPCSDFLQRLAKLQQRIFNVNRCLYYLESNPDDRPGTIDDLIAKVIEQESREFDDNDRSLFEPCKEDDVGS